MDQVHSLTICVLILLCNAGDLFCHVFGDALCQFLVFSAGRLFLQNLLDRGYGIKYLLNEWSQTVRIFDGEL